MAIDLQERANPPNLTVSNTTAPAGGWAQIKIYAPKPASITTGHLVLNLDAAVFGEGAMVGLFGANGDALGMATTTGAKIDVQFSSPTGGMVHNRALSYSCCIDRKNSGWDSEQRDESRAERIDRFDLRDR